MENFNLDNQIQKLAKAVQFKVARSIKKYNVQTTTTETVNIDISKTSTGYTIIFSFREGLRWTNLGTGNGYKGGKKLNRRAYETNIAKYATSRKKKPVIYRNIYWMIHSLREIGGVTVVQETAKSIETILTPTTI